MGNVLLSRTRLGRLARALVVPALMLATASAGQAQGVLPADIADDLQRAAADIRRQGDHDREVGRRLNGLGLEPISAPSDPAYASDVMGAAVIGAIARRPALAGAIVAAAVSAVPEARGGIVDSASTAFPTFAPQIRAAGGGPASRAAAPAPPTATAAWPATPAVRPAPSMATPASPGDMAAEGEPEMEPIGGSSGDIADPWEGFNRAIFAFNDTVDTYLLKPVASAYGWVLPEPVKRSVRNGFSNVMSPVVLANDLLQFEFRDAAITASRLIANSTMGIGGLFDVATEMGLPPHPGDFGQTLHSYGVDSGPYLVLPLLGPSSVRDGFGLGVDAVTHPFFWVLSTPVNLGVTGGRTIVRREELIEPLDELREGSLDYYAALRSAYAQNRAVDLRRGRPAESSDVDDMFDSFQ